MTAHAARQASRPTWPALLVALLGAGFAVFPQAVFDLSGGLMGMGGAGVVAIVVLLTALALAVRDAGGRGRRTHWTTVAAVVISTLGLGLPVLYVSFALAQRFPLIVVQLTILVASAVLAAFVYRDISAHPAAARTALPAAILTVLVFPIGLLLWALSRTRSPTAPLPDARMG